MCYTFIAYKNDASSRDYDYSFYSDFQLTTDMSIDDICAESIKLLSYKREHFEPEYEIHVLWNGHEIYAVDGGWYNDCVDITVEYWYDEVSNCNRDELSDALDKLKSIQTGVKQNIEDWKRHEEELRAKKKANEIEQTRLRELAMLSALQSKYQGKQ